MSLKKTTNLTQNRPNSIKTIYPMNSQQIPRIPRKSISFDSLLNHEKTNDKANIEKKQKKAKNNKNYAKTNHAVRSKFNIYDTLKSVNDISQTKNEKTDHVISLLHIIKTLKKAANLLKSKAGISPVQILNDKEIAFMNDLSYFPDISSRRFFLKRYTEKNVRKHSNKTMIVKSI